MTRFRNSLLFSLMAAASTLSFGQAAQQAPIPDFSGTWAHPSIPGFEPLASGPTSLVNRSRSNGIANLARLNGDYTNPILKPDAAQIVKQHAEMSLAGFGYPTPRNQCWPGGVPFVLPTNGMQMFQRPDKITIIYAVDHQVRHIRMNGTHPANLTPSWYGDSVGHYEGETLVIDTVGVKIGPFAMVDWYGTPHSPALRVVERYRLIDYDEAKNGLDRDSRENFTGRSLDTGIEPFGMDPNYRGKYLQLLVTVEDENVFATPWSATVTYGHPLGPWLELVCAENPRKYGTEKDVQVPAAEKPDF
jgi:hypothetical protein